MTAPSTIVVAISRQFGSGGAYVGHLVAMRLGYQYLDREILKKAADLLGVEEERLRDLDERTPGFWERLLQGLAHGSPDAPYVPPPLQPLQEDVLKAQRAVMSSVARSRSCVIVGRGGAHFLRDHPGLFSIFLHAPLEKRVERVRRMYHLEPEHAQSLVEETDAERERFLSSLRGRGWTDARNYHLCLDLGACDFIEAREVIVSLAIERARRLA